MASTYSNIKIQLMATGENSGTWGNVTNANLGDAIEQALVETATVTFASANVTLTLSDSNSRQDARALRLNLTGTTGGARDLIVPAIQKPYLVNNGTADTITVKVSGQTGIAVPASTSMLLYNNGTDVGLAFNRVVGDLVGTASNATVLQTARTIAISGNVTGTATSFDGSANISIDATAVNADGITSGTLAVARGGTSATTLNAEAVVIGNGTSAVKFVAPGTDGNVLTSNGTAWVSEAISIAGGLSGSQGFTSPGTFTAPPTTTKVYVFLQAGGGGGSGGGVNPGNLEPNAGYPGAGGGTAFGVVSVTGGSPYTVTVGAAGTGGARKFIPGGAGTAGNPGGASSFSNLISANGGGGGTNLAPGGGNPGAAGTGVSPTGTAVPGGSILSIQQSGGLASSAFSNGGAGGPPGPAGGGNGTPGYVFVAF